MYHHYFSHWGQWPIYRSLLRCSINLILRLSFPANRGMVILHDISNTVWMIPLVLESWFIYCFYIIMSDLYNIVYISFHVFLSFYSYSASDLRGSSNKFWQWSHISETVIVIRIILPVACGRWFCLFMFEIWSFYHDLILCYTNL